MNNFFWVFYIFNWPIKRFKRFSGRLCQVCSFRFVKIQQFNNFLYMNWKFARLKGLALTPFLLSQPPIIFLFQNASCQKENSITTNLNQRLYPTWYFLFFLISTCLYWLLKTNHWKEFLTKLEQVLFGYEVLTVEIFLDLLDFSKWIDKVVYVVYVLLKNLWYTKVEPVLRRFCIFWTVILIFLASFTFYWLCCL